MTSETPEVLVEKAINNPTLFHCGYLLQQDAVKQLSTSNPQLHQLLQIFAYGTLDDLPGAVNLSATALNKLRQLTLVTCASESRELHYNELLLRLRLDSESELECFIIDSIYSELVKGRLDSRKKVFQVDDWMARDVPPSRLPQMLETLKIWMEDTAILQQSTLAQADEEDKQLQETLARKQQQETQIQEARQAMEESLNRESYLQTPDRIGKRQQRPSGIRGKLAVMSNFTNVNK